MKMYTNSDQTAKLIELGFVPKVEIKEVRVVHSKVKIDHDCYFAIGELLSFLPLTIQWTPRVIRGNVIEYSFETEGSELYYCNSYNELIDNLYDMILQLKEEGVI